MLTSIVRSNHNLWRNLFPKSSSNGSIDRVSLVVGEGGVGGGKKHEIYAVAIFVTFLTYFYRGGQHGPIAFLSN